MAFPIAAAVALAAEFAPSLIRWLADDEKAAVVAEKVGTVAKTLTGSGDPAEIAEQLRQNAQRSTEFKIMLANHALELERMDLEDRRDARARDIALRASGDRNVRANIMVGGCFLVLVVCVGVVLAYGLRNWALTGEAIAIVSTVATGALACLKDAFGFEFGSSRSSKDKDVLLAGIIKNGHG